MANPIRNHDAFRSQFDHDKSVSVSEFNGMTERDRLKFGIECTANGYAEVLQSIRQNEIVHMEYDPGEGLFVSLQQICDDWTDSNDGYELWGHIDNDEWRVHLDFTKNVVR